MNPAGDTPNDRYHRWVNPCCIILIAENWLAFAIDAGTPSLSWQEVPTSGLRFYLIALVIRYHHS